MNNRDDLLRWLGDVFIDRIDPRSILMGDSQLGFTPQLTFNDGRIICIHKTPYTAIKKKYRLISNEVPLYYYDNIKLIRKLERFLEVPFVMLFEQDNQKVLINLSTVKFYGNSGQTTFEEDYALHLLVNHGDYHIINIKETDFFDTLDALLTKQLVEMVSDKKFSELSNDELSMVRIYHYK